MATRTAQIIECDICGAEVDITGMDATHRGGPLAGWFRLQAHHKPHTRIYHKDEWDVCSLKCLEAFCVPRVSISYKQPRSPAA